MDRTCSVEDCDKPTRSHAADWCKMHYHRWYRHGNVETTAIGVPTANTSGPYRRLYLPSHPLAGTAGTVYTHRAVLYEKIGPGPHACSWCGTEVDWLPAADPRELQADHVNGVRDDNKPDNIVPSCQPCNTGRAAQSRHAALVAAGWWSGHDTIARLKRGGRKGRFADGPPHRRAEVPQQRNDDPTRTRVAAPGHP